MKSYSGRCHCEKVTFDFDLDAPITKGIRCNCSICRRLGAIISPKIAPSNFNILTGADNLKVYLFGDKVVQHCFCSNCGVYVFYTGSQCKVNLGCVDSIDTFTLPVEIYDGKHLL